MNRLCVVKVGGSLLDWPELPAALDDWLARQAVASVLVCGGGRWVDEVRQAWRTHQLSEETAHELSIQAMGLTARMLAEILPGAAFVSSDDRDRLRTHVNANARVVVDVSRFMRNGGAEIPHCWTVTSDSIAVFLAGWVGADECVLLKSADTPKGDWRRLADADYVDAWFPHAAQAFAGSIRCVNLRTFGQ